MNKRYEEGCGTFATRSDQSGSIRAPFIQISHAKRNASASFREPGSTGDDTDGHDCKQIRNLGIDLIERFSLVVSTTRTLAEAVSCLPDVFMVIKCIRRRIDVFRYSGNIVAGGHNSGDLIFTQNS